MYVEISYHCFQILDLKSLIVIRNDRCQYKQAQMHNFMLRVYFVGKRYVVRLKFPAGPGQHPVGFIGGEVRSVSS